jgi:CubicO group peptidase (beta-lactamase class C family)
LEAFSFTEDFIEQMKGYKVKDFVVMDHDSTVCEWHAEGKDRINFIFSCTKSILSALVGIAIELGFLKDVDQPITDFLEVGADKKDITIEHLLTMTSGIDWPIFDKPANSMKSSKDPVRFVLERGMAAKPGSKFAYNSGGSHLLSAILSEASGLSALDFAHKHVFHHLGFVKPTWKSMGPYSMGGSGLHIRSVDMAAFGRLYLNKGRVGGTQVISGDWIETSTAIHHPGYHSFSPQIFGYYGYHWWVSPESHNGICSYYYALGHGGQYIFVVPDYGLVVAVRKTVEGRSDSVLPRLLVHQWMKKLRARG